MSKSVNIAILEPSQIIYEGIISLFRQTNLNFNFYKADNLSEIQQLSSNHNLSVILINPTLILNHTKIYKALKKELLNTHWIGLVYAFFDKDLLNEFDDIITINDSSEVIINKIKKSNLSEQNQDKEQSEALTERESEVLKLLVTGKANKEIADTLFISTHTVISHRKNISKKTGIKSVSGLTIYAVVNHLITIDNLKE